MRRSAVFAVCLGIVVALTGCAGRAVDEDLLPTRVPTLDPQAMVLAAQAAQVEPEPTATDTPLPPTPEPAATEPPTQEPAEASVTPGSALAEPTAVDSGAPDSAVAPMAESEIITETSPAAEAITQTESITDTTEALVPVPTAAVTPVPPAEPVASDTAASTAEVDPVLAGLPDSLLAAMADADPDNGENLTRSVACSGCHSVDPNQLMAGPTWYNLSKTAAERIEGQSAGLYLYHSIMAPNDYVVEGYQPNIMIQTYKDTLTEQDLADIIAHLLTLRAR